MRVALLILFASLLLAAASAYPDVENVIINGGITIDPAGTPNITVDIVANDTTMDTVVAKCWGPSKAEGTCTEDGWDCEVGITLTDPEVDGTYYATWSASEKAESGTWTCKVTANQTDASTNSSTDTETMNTRLAISLDDASCSTASANPATDDVAFDCESGGTPPFFKITHDGNSNYDLSISITGILTSGGNTIANSNVYYCNVGSSVSGACDTACSDGYVTNTDCVTTCGATESTLDSSQTIVSGWTRGAEPTSSVWYNTFYLDIPDSTAAGSYDGTITITYGYS